MRISRLSYGFLLGFLLGIVALQWWQVPEYPVWVWGIAGGVALLGAAGRMPALVAAVMGILVAFLIVAHTTHVPSPDSIDRFANGSTVTLHGRIAEDPDRRADAIRYTIEATTLEYSGTLLPVSGLVLATDRGMWPLYRYGDHVRVQGNLEKPGTVEDFHYDRYLSRYDIYSVIYRATFTTEKQNDGNRVLTTLYGFKRATETRIAELFPEPQSSLLIGLLTGSRGTMDPKLQVDFQTTGLTHLVAISGYNITMIITILGLAFFWLPLKWRFLPSVLVIAGFTLFTGASASVVRAAIMGCLGLLALHLGRQQTTRLTILWTAFFMLVWNPKQLWYDAGFQLSFLSLLGITEVSPLLEPLVRWIPEKFGLRQSLQLTLSAQVTTVPWTLHLFERLSLIAPVSNVLAPPFVPYAMLFGAASAVLSVVSPILAQIASIPAYLVLWVITAITKLLAVVPYAAIDVPAGGALFLGIYYSALAAILVRKDRKDHQT